MWMGYSRHLCGNFTRKKLIKSLRIMSLCPRPVFEVVIELKCNVVVWSFVLYFYFCHASSFEIFDLFICSEFHSMLLSCFKLTFLSAHYYRQSVFHIFRFWTREFNTWNLYLKLLVTGVQYLKLIYPIVSDMSILFGFNIFKYLQ